MLLILIMITSYNINYITDITDVTHYLNIYIMMAAIIFGFKFYYYQ